MTTGVQIDTYGVTSRTARQFRRLHKFGNHVADYLGTGASERAYPGFGNGTGYTVANWISDGVFPNLAAVQTEYPICQSTSDTVDWVLWQTAIDDTIYSNLGSSNYGLTKRLLMASAGKYVCNRPLHVGYVKVGTPPSGLNGNGYVSIDIEGEGLQIDSSGNGMPGVTIQFTSQCGFVYHGYQDCKLIGIAIEGPYKAFFEANMNAIIHAPEVWNPETWKPPGISSDNWLGGNAVSIGVGMDLYTSDASAAAYPARALPAAFGGGTTSDRFSLVGGTGLHLEYCRITGFILQFGRPHGDNNGEFFTFRHGRMSYGVYSAVFGHSQGRNHALENVDIFGMHTVLTSKGGTKTNSNLHGDYSNVHTNFVYQWIDHEQSDWSGPVELTKWYGEVTHTEGRFTGGAALTLRNCYLSSIETDALDGVPPTHFDISSLFLDTTLITGIRHGLFGSGNPSNVRRIQSINSVIVTEKKPNYENHTNYTQIARGVQYMNGIFQIPGLNTRKIIDLNGLGRFGTAGDHQAYNYSWLSEMTFVDQEFAEYQPVYPEGALVYVGSAEMQGAVQRFPVPKFAKAYQSVTVASRSGYDLTCTRITTGSIKADVGDVFCLLPTGADATLKTDTWFVCVSISGSNMVLRQLNNYYGSSQYDYQTNGRYQIASGSYNDSYYIMTRIKSHAVLWVGDVTAGSNVISNVKAAFTYGSGDVFGADHFFAAVGDFHLHQEIERANTGGSGLSVQNKIKAIDFSANTITLTDNFNITKTNYALPFYVKVYNA